MRLILLTLLLSFSAINEADADNSCLNNQLVVDSTFVWDIAAMQSLNFYLPSIVSSGPFLTKAALHIDPISTLEAQVLVDFKLPNMVSNPYNLYKVEIQTGYTNYSVDLTESCEKSGKSIYPGQFLLLPALPLNPTTGGLEQVHIRVWGHL